MATGCKVEYDRTVFALTLNLRFVKYNIILTFTAAVYQFILIFDAQDYDLS